MTHTTTKCRPGSSSCLSVSRRLETTSGRSYVLSVSVLASLTSVVNLLVIIGNVMVIAAVFTHSKLRSTTILALVLEGLVLVLLVPVLVRSQQAALDHNSCP